MINQKNIEQIFNDYKNGDKLSISKIIEIISKLDIEQNDFIVPNHCNDLLLQFSTEHPNLLLDIEQFGQLLKTLFPEKTTDTNLSKDTITKRNKRNTYFGGYNNKDYMKFQLSDEETKKSNIDDRKRSLQIPRPASAMSFSMVESQLDTLSDTEDNRFCRSLNTKEYSSSSESISDKRRSSQVLKIKRVTSNLSKQLANAQEHADQVSLQSQKRISELEKENSSLKTELGEKRKEINSLVRSDHNISKQLIKIESENMKLNTKVEELRKKLQETKKEGDNKSLEEKNLLSKISQQDSQIIQLEHKIKTNNIEIKKFKDSNIELSNKLKNLERDFSFAQSMLQSFDAIKNENIILQNTIIELQNKLDDEDIDPVKQHLDNLDSLFSEVNHGSFNSSLRTSRNSTMLQGLAADSNDSKEGFFDPLPTHLNTINGVPMPNPKYVKELEKENLHLRKHLETTWTQWDSIKNELQDLVSNDSSSRRDTIKKSNSYSWLDSMEKIRPKRSNSRPARPSIQPLLSAFESENSSPDYTKTDMKFRSNKKSLSIEASLGSIQPNKKSVLIQRRAKNSQANLKELLLGDRSIRFSSDQDIVKNLTKSDSSSEASSLVSTPTVAMDGAFTTVMTNGKYSPHLLTPCTSSIPSLVPTSSNRTSFSLLIPTKVVKKVQVKSIKKSIKKQVHGWKWEQQGKFRAFKLIV